ncbi:serpin [Finch poxvirus]|uniref:Serpin n=1 Tax=Condorpox virus TaxID=3049970 RepID=A0AAT9UPB3_9POXV|nr:serpin [Finch poxvirus]UOX39187.1 serpin [Finch poxvirus]
MANISTINNKLALITKQFYDAISKSFHNNIIISPPCIMLIARALLKASSDRTKSQLLEIFDTPPDMINIDKILLEILSNTQFEAGFFLNDDKHINTSYKRYINKTDAITITNTNARYILDMMERLHFDPNNMFSEDEFESILLFDISYLGIWETVFTDYDCHTFNVSKYVSIRVPYMATKGMLGYTYCTDIKSHVINIPYMYNTHSLILLFTDSYQNFKYLESHITARILTSSKMLFYNMYYSDICVVIPKFSVTVQHDMKSAFMNLGITDIFKDDCSMRCLSPNKVSLTELYVKSQIGFLNNRFILNDQKRWEKLSGTKYMLTRPFMFCIRYNKTGSIVFFGKIKDPSQ